MAIVELEEKFIVVLVKKIRSL